jgi:hypothetical protein
LNPCCITVTPDDNTVPSSLDPTLRHRRNAAPKGVHAMLKGRIRTVSFTTTSEFKFTLIFITKDSSPGRDGHGQTFTAFENLLAAAATGHSRRCEKAATGHSRRCEKVLEQRLLDPRRFSLAKFSHVLTNFPEVFRA